MEDLVDALSLVPFTDPVLLTPAERFEGSVADAKLLESLMVEAMNRSGGLGLSACQVGIRSAVLVVKTSPAQCLFNPRVIDQTEDGEEQDEACLSFPGLVAPVWRPKAIKVRFLTSDGQTHTEKYGGMTARVIMHEVDHLAGRVFFDRLGDVGLQMAVKKAAKRGFDLPLGKLKIIAKKSRENA